MVNWKDIGVPLITTILGSSLLGLFITILASELNKPYISFEIDFLGQICQDDKIKNLLNKIERCTPEKTNLTYSIFDIYARNIGKEPAKNVTIGLYFLKNIKNYSLPINEKKIVSYEFNDNNTAGPNGLNFYTNQLNRNELVVIRVLLNDSIDTLFYNPWEKEYEVSSADLDRFRPDKSQTSYFISANYENGSNEISRIFNTDIGTPAFPNIPSQLKLSFTSWVIILSITLSFILFAFAAVGQRWKKFKEGKFRELFFIILGISLLIHIITEYLPSYIMEEKFTELYKGEMFNPSLKFSLFIIYYLFLLSIIRVHLSFFLIKKILRYYYKENISKFNFRYNLKFYLFGLIIIGIPMHNIFMTFDYFVGYTSSDYIIIINVINSLPILIIIDISRISLLTYIISKKFQVIRL